MSDEDRPTGVPKPGEPVAAGNEPQGVVQGGMLSGSAIRKLIVREKDPDAGYLKFFKDRNWPKIKEEYGGYEKGLIIEPYNELNLTPFSYDLSVGDEVFSLQKPEDGMVSLGLGKPGGTEYRLEPGETLVVLTKELVAISRFHSATIWPRFDMVRQGVFQSLVKIDPTWWGNLAVAVTNMSPATVPVRWGHPFCTLILYELSSETDIDLWRHQDLEPLEVDLPKDLPKDELERFLLTKPDRLRSCAVVGNQLRVTGIKRRLIDELKTQFQDKTWQEFFDKAVGEGWAASKHSKTHRRMIGMDALGMASLGGILANFAEENRVHPEQIIGKECQERDLFAAARHYGKPFDLVAQIPYTVRKTIEEELGPRLAAQIESNIQPRVITLLLSTLGIISLIVALLGLGLTAGGGKWVDNPVVCYAFAAIASLLGVVAIVALRILHLSKRLRPREYEKEIGLVLEEILEGPRKKADSLQERLDKMESRCDELREQIEKKASDRTDSKPD